VPVHEPHRHGRDRPGARLSGAPGEEQEEGEDQAEEEPGPIPHLLPDRQEQDLSDRVEPWHQARSLPRVRAMNTSSRVADRIRRSERGRLRSCAYWARAITVAGGLAVCRITRPSSSRTPVTAGSRASAARSAGAPPVSSSTAASG